jgi:hypothetical protein
MTAGIRLAMTGAIRQSLVAKPTKLAPRDDPKPVRASATKTVPPPPDRFATARQHRMIKAIAPKPMAGPGKNGEPTQTIR